MHESIYLILLCGCFLFGYLLGRVDLLVCRSSQKDAAPTPQNFFTRVGQSENKTANTLKTAAADIDTRVFVAPLTTSDMVKNSDVTIGKTNVVDDDINKSVSKLAQLKGK
jgi:hypothetical protein